MREIDDFDIATEMGEDMPTNKERADRAYKTVFEYTLITPPEPEEYDFLCDGIVDLLTDLMHLCDREKLEFMSLLEDAERHHEVEIRASIIKMNGGSVESLNSD